MSLSSEISKLCKCLSALYPKIGEGAGKEYEVREYLKEALKKKKTSGSGQFCYSDNSTATNGAGKNIVKLRGGPGKLEANTGKKYTHFLFQDGRDKQELHASVQVQGDSGAGHELDIMIVKSDLRKLCSSKKCDFFCFPVGKGIECKDYSGIVDKNLARAFALVNRDHTINDAEFRTSGEVSKPTSQLLRHYGIKLNRVP